MFRSFDEITNDIGSELKFAAGIIYSASIFLCAIVAILEIFGGIALLFVAESFWGILGIIIGTIAGIAFEIVIIMFTAYLITILLYSKGETVHLLNKIADPEKTETEKIVERVSKKSVAEMLSQLTKKTETAEKHEEEKKETLFKPVSATPVAKKPSSPKWPPEQPSKPGNWICICGSENAKYVSTCYCGVSRKEAKRLWDEEAKKHEST